MRRTTVIGELTESMHEFIDYFCDKQKLCFEGWVGDNPGGVAIFGNGMNLYFHDIVLDVMADIEPGEITAWYSSSEANALAGNIFITYNAYIKGFRV